MFSFSKNNGPQRLPASAVMCTAQSQGEFWGVDPSKGTPIDIGEPRYAMAFAEAARSLNDVSRFVQRFGLMNSGLRQGAEEMQSQFEQLAEFTATLGSAGLFYKASDAARELLPIGVGKMSNAVAMANVARDALDMELCFATNGRKVGIEYKHENTLQHHLWAQAFAFMQSGGVPVDVCGYCGTLFAPANKRQAFCSTSCRAMSHRAKQ